MNEVFVVKYKDESEQVQTIIVITNIPHSTFRSNKTMLDWYAEKYAIDRSKLSGYFIDCIDYKE